VAYNSRDVIREQLRAIRDLAPRHVLLLGFALFVLYAFPGYMSTDSVVQLAEARSGQLSDAHPPIMAKEWSVLDAIVSGPLLMIVLQCLLFLGGTYVILRARLAPRPAAWTAIAILLFPPVLTPLGVVWKDSQMAAYLVAGTAAMIQPQLRLRLVGLGLYVVACALRHNAFAAVVPLVFFLFEWRPGVVWWKRVVVLLGAAVLTVGLTFAVTRVLTVRHVKLTPVFTDIAGVLAFGHDRSDAELEQLLGDTLVVHHDIQAHAKQLWFLRGSWRIAAGEQPLLVYPKSEAQWDTLDRAWKALVFDEPGAYLASHWSRFDDLIATPRAEVWTFFVEVPATHPQMVTHLAGPSRLQFKVAAALDWLDENTPLFEPRLYLLVALLLLAVACRDRLTGGLFASGLAYQASFFPVGVDPDYRYSHWMIVTVVLASVILFIERFRKPT